MNEDFKEETGLKAMLYAIAMENGGEVCIPDECLLNVHPTFKIETYRDDLRRCYIIRAVPEISNSTQMECIPLRGTP
ncbi:MAG: hypothetical protein A2Y38_24050 [Spirochaetes bacterium GWB1_59_5]|nr:MAG: hypothetical protein A2Y38_24050 [Spirochaetes bacterium GWB1_59_5]